MSANSLLVHLLQTPSAVNRIRLLLQDKPEFVSISNTSQHVWATFIKNKSIFKWRWGEAVTVACVCADRYEGGGEDARLQRPDLHPGLHQGKGQGWRGGPSGWWVTSEEKTGNGKKKKGTSSYSVDELVRGPNTFTRHCVYSTCVFVCIYIYAHVLFL